MVQGDHALAASRWAESLRQWRALRNRRGVADGLAGLAGVFQARGEPEALTRLLGAADALLEEVGARHLVHAAALDPRLAEARVTLDGSMAAVWEQGRAAWPEEVVAEALALAISDSTRAKRLMSWTKMRSPMS